METSATVGPRFAALQHRNFRLLWVGLIVSNVGTWMQNVGLGWLVLQLTNSPLWLGLLGLSFALPMTFLPPFSGALVDRLNRVRLLFFTQTALMANALVLGCLTWFHVVQVWHMLAASFIGATLLALDNPARQALIPDLVPRRDLLNALSLNAATYNGAALLGPALAGTLLGPFGAGSLFFLNGLSYLAVLLALTRLRDVQTHGGPARGSLLGSALSGLTFAWRSQFVLALLALSALAAVFGRSYQNLLPIFARDIWGGGAKGYGFLLSSAGAGALVGAFGLAAIPEVKRYGAVLVVSGVCFSLALVVFALSPSLLLGMLCLFVVGVAGTVFGTVIATFIQIASPNEMRGRIMSLYTVTLIGLPSLGALGSGSLAELLGGIPGAPRAVLIGALAFGAVLFPVSPLLWPRTIGPAET